MVVAAGTRSSRRVRVRIGATGRRALLTGHIITGVGLLGSVAVVLAINIRAATTADTQLAASSYDLLAMLTLLFGIPLSFASLISGVLLGLSSQWGGPALRLGHDEARAVDRSAPDGCARTGTGHRLDARRRRRSGSAADCRRQLRRVRAAVLDRILRVQAAPSARPSRCAALGCLLSRRDLRR